DFYSGQVNSFNGDLASSTGTGGFLVAPNTPIAGRGISVNAVVSNRFDLNDTIFVEPLAGLTYGKYSFNDVFFNPQLGINNGQGTMVNGRMAIAPVESWLARLGANFGGTFLVSDNLAVAPFVHASVWREFGAQVQATAFAQVGTQSFTFPVNVDRVGTFGQIGVGAQFKVLSMDLLGFVRGDMRFGDNLNGK